MKIYLASPLGFADSTRQFMHLLQGEIESCGFEVLNPWSRSNKTLFEEAASIPGAAERLERLREINVGIAVANVRDIENSDIMIAVLDGVDVDSGTASEVGFAYGLGKIVFGLRTDFRASGDNEAVRVNLQVQYFIEASGGQLGSNVTELLSVINLKMGSLYAPYLGTKNVDGSGD